MRKIIALSLTALLMLVCIGVSTSGEAAYTNIILDKVESQPGFVTGTNPFTIHDWDKEDHVNDTHAALYTPVALPAQYQLKFKVTTYANPENVWNPLIYPYGSVEFQLSIMDETVKIPGISDDFFTAGKAKTKLQYFQIREQINIKYFGTDNKVYNYDGYGWWTWPSQIEILSDPYLPLVRYVEFIKDATNYTVNYYDQDNVLFTSGTVPIASVKSTTGDIVVIGDPNKFDNSVKCTVEYLGNVLPPGTYTELADGWNMVASQHEAAIPTANVRFSNDSGVTQVTAVQAEANGWVQGTLYYFDEGTGMFKTAPGDASDVAWEHAYWVYAEQPGITMIMLW